jgi:Flp pilus assembly protein TadG
VSTATDTRSRTRAARATDERGIAAIWLAITIFLMLGVAAIAVDLVNGLLQAQKAQNAADAASLSGVVYLPDGGAASANALEIARENGYSNASGTLVSATRTGDYSLKVEVKRTFNTFFARAIGFDSLTVSKSATATYEPPSAQAQPLDLMLVLDRTSSMVTAPHPEALEKLRTASNALLDSLDPSMVKVALALTGPSTTSTCSGGGYGVAAPQSGIGSGLWVVAPQPATTNPTADYVSSSSLIRKTINCMGPSSVGTNLGDPIAQAQAYMVAHHNPGAKQAIILMTDGEANGPNSASCTYAYNKATAAKAAGIEIITIGFGIEGHTCTVGTGENGAYKDKPVTLVLAELARPAADGTPSDDNLACTGPGDDVPENQDNDNFYCVPKDQDLAKIFVQAAGQLTAKRAPRLIG